MPTEVEQSAYHELTAWTVALGDPEFIHQEVVDAWAVQHATHDSKPISVLFGLLGLYLYLEKGFSGRAVQRAHMQLAQPNGRRPGRKDWPRFPLPADRGAVTATDVIAAPESERKQAIHRWCQSVWDAWQESHAAVADWVHRNLGV